MTDEQLLLRHDAPPADGCRGSSSSLPVPIRQDKCCLFHEPTTAPRVPDGYISLSTRGHARARATRVLNRPIYRKNVIASARS